MRKLMGMRGSPSARPKPRAGLRCSAANRGPKIKIRHPVLVTGLQPRQSSSVVTGFKARQSSPVVTRVNVFVFPAFIELEFDTADLDH